jgi:hypothetical protein
MMDRVRILRRVLEPLRPYLEEVVLIGGWVALLYLQRLGKETSHTIEADILLPETLLPKGRPTLAEALQGAGYSPGRGGTVWRGRVEEGEQVEFLASHEGTAAGEGATRVIPEHPGVGAVSLSGLWVFLEANRQLPIPGSPPMRVTVPRCGVFVANKANTFPRRPRDAGRHLRAGKDLLYLFDLMGGGTELLDEIRGDLAQFCDAGRRERFYLERARNHASLLGDGVMRGHLMAASEMLQVREGISPGEAEVWMRDRMGLLVSILEECLR